MAKKLLSTTENETKRGEIENSLETANYLWNSLKDRVDGRKDKLDDTLLAAVKFNLLHDEVSEKLQSLAKEVNSEVNTPSATKEKVEEQIVVAKHLSEQIVAIEPILKALYDHLRNLELYCTPEESVLVEDKVSNQNKHFQKAKQACLAIDNKLQYVQQLLEEYSRIKKDLKEWMKRVKDDLIHINGNDRGDKIKSIKTDVNTHKADVDKLKEQLKELKKLVKVDEYPILKTIGEEIDHQYKSITADVEEFARGVFITVEKIQAFDTMMNELVEWTNDKLNKQILGKNLRDS
jgi:hypothetical protein